jgi:hypothetical protein
MTGDTPPPTGCRWCGEAHGPLCPMVKALEFAPDGVTVTRVEFLTAADFPAHKEQQPQEGEQPDYERIKPGWK